MIIFLLNNLKACSIIGIKIKREIGKRGG